MYATIVGNVMNRFQRTAFWGLAAVWIFCGARASDTSDTAHYFFHTVKKGETVSLLAIDYFGVFTPEFCAQLLKDNPSIHDVNLIFVGQSIRLHSPHAIAPAPSPAAFETKVAATQGVVTYVEGHATIVPKKTHTQCVLGANTPVYPGDVIETLADGKVEIIINRETVIRLRERSKATIEALRDNSADKGKTQVGFSVGALWTKMKKFKDAAARFELELPTAIAGVHGTVYESVVNRDSSAEVKVFEGEVAVAGNQKRPEGEAGFSEVSGPKEVAGPQEVSMEQWVHIIKNMERIVIDKKGKPKPVEAFTDDPRDAWELWNKQRDERIAQMFGEAGK